MNIPAMDAVRSKRFGYISTEEANIAITLYDDLVENRNFGGSWRVPKPVFIQTEEPVDVVEIVENADYYDKCNFSGGFWEEIAKIYRGVSEHYENPDVDIIPRNGENDFEAMFISHTLNVLMNEGPTHELWNTVLSDAQFNRIEDNETGDVNLFGEDENRDFVESEFHSNDYIPNPEELEEWGLYSYSWRKDGCEVDSLWVRFRDKNGVKEYPLIENLNGLTSIVSTEPDFGTVESNHISEKVQEALAEGRVLFEDGTDVEQALTETVDAVENMSDKTSFFIENATESERVVSE